MSLPPVLARFATVALAALTVAVAGAPPALAGPADPREASPSERAAATVRPALVRLTGHFVGWVQDERGAFFNGGQAYEQTLTCTGFGVHPDGYVATAAHCVDTSSGGAIGDKFIELAAQEAVANTPGIALEDAVSYGLANWTVEGNATDSPIDAQLFVGGTPGGPVGDAGLPARVVDIRPFPDGDVALLKVEGADLPVLELTTGSEIPVGTPLLSAGYPGNVGELLGPNAEPSIKDGEVSGRQSVGGSEVYEISAPMSPGMSGGPAIDMGGRVLGINSFGPATDGGSSFAFIASAAEMAELLGRNGVRNELGPVDRLYREALDAHYAGRFSDAISAFDRVLQAMPAHAQAAKLRTDAIAARDQFGDPGIPPVVLWSVIGGAAVLVSGIGVVLVTVRRSRRRAAVAGWPQHPGYPAGPGWQGPPAGPYPGLVPPAPPYPRPAPPAGPGAAFAPPHHPYPGPTPAGPGPWSGDGPTRRIDLPANPTERSDGHP